LLLGSLLGSTAEAEVPGEPVGVGDAEGVGDADRDADGEGDGEVLRDGVGEGVGVGDVDGSTWHLVSVVVAAVVVTGRSEPARAMLDQVVSMPRIRKPPASKLSVVARACPKRIEIALSALLVAVTLRSPRFGAN
jgi:hypothetical protein